MRTSRETGKHLCFGAFPHLSRIKVKFPLPLRHFCVSPPHLSRIIACARSPTCPVQHRCRNDGLDAYSPRSFTLREQTSADIFRYFLSPRRLRTPPPRRIYMQRHRCSARRSQVSHARRARRSVRAAPPTDTGLICFRGRSPPVLISKTTSFFARASSASVAGPI